MTSTTKPVRPELANFEVFVDTCLRLAARDGRQLPPELADRRRWDRAYRNLVLLTAEHSNWPGPADRDRQRPVDPGTRRSAVTWPLRIGSIPPRADGFQDRTVADVLDYKARQGQAVVLTQVVSGLGGVGKTQLAAAFAKRLWSTGELDLLVWISAVSRDSVVTGYAQAADMVLGSHDDNKDPNLAATRFLAWLDMTDKRWLVVLDDLRDGTVAQGLWPPDRPVGRTVVTTRRRDASLLTGRSLIDVGVFTSQEATDYIAGKLPTRLADDVEGVAADLGSLPLALGHAAAYMIDQDISCLSYRQRFADQRRRLASLFPDEGAIFEGPAATVATTWALSIVAANGCEPVGLAQPLIELAAVLNPNGIPEELFTSDAPHAHISATARPAVCQDPVQVSAADIRDGLRCLHRFNLVTHDAELLRVHALVQRAVRDDLSEQRLLAIVRSAADGLLQIWPDIDRNAERIRLLRANATALHAGQPEALWTPGGAHRLLLRTARSLGEGEAPLLADAVRYTQELHEQAVRYLGAEHCDTLGIRNQLAHWLGDSGSIADAVSSLEELVADTAQLLGPDHPSTLDARGNLGYERGQAGDPLGAVAELTGVCADQARALGFDHPTTMQNRNNLAFWQGKAGDSASAIAILQRLLPDVLRIFGPDHPDTLDVRGNLAFWRGDAGDPVGAAQELATVLKDMTRILGPDHRDVSVIQHNLAHWRGQAGDTAGAMQVLTEVYRYRLRVFGPDHRDTLVTRFELARLSAKRGDPTGAATELEKVLLDQQRVFGADHPITMSIRHDLACLRGDLGNPSAAITALEKVLADRRRVLGADHPETIKTLEKLHYWQTPPNTTPPRNSIS
ncbi:MAG: FxSxx-COOH system tetratricopeptide repeat protein [Pseudonocardiaceae bacterium]